MAEYRRVWVLGSGFSRALGGPLLSDLFTLASQHKMTQFFPSDRFPLLHDDNASFAMQLYRHGLITQDSCDGPFNLWDNPESFLDQIDSAVLVGEASQSRRFLLRVLEAARKQPLRKDQENLDAISASARRRLAAECTAFLQENDPDAERWLPYVSWSCKLSPQDTVITFNYDLVLETLADHHSAPITFVLPGDELSPGLCSVLKLHGSVDWRRHTSGSRSRPQFLSDDDLSALKVADDELAIAAPGPSKHRKVQELEALWRAAESQLQSADAVTFMGYRFPPTDAEACQRLLGAISQNTKERLAIGTVLGPEIGNRDSTRLTELLRIASPNKGPNAVRAYPLYAQDFLTIYDVGWYADEIKKAS